jgi:DedD protein
MATRPAVPARRRAGGAEDGVADPALPQKKRARHRLIGAIALCLLAAIVVPLLLESEPTRPSSDVAIVIPSRDTPLAPRAAAVPESRPGEGRGGDAKAVDPKAVEARVDPARTGEAKASGAIVARGTIDSSPAADAAAKDGKGAAKDAAKVDPKSDPKAAVKAEPRKDEIGALAEAAQAKARTEAGGRYLLQVGAFGGEAGANAAVERVQSAGLRAFTEKVKTDRGERVRVRVGPFASREAAEQARSTLKAAGIEAAVIAP